jgi:hypothetical protein
MQKWELFRKFPFLPLKLSTLCRQLERRTACGAPQCFIIQLSFRFSACGKYARVLRPVIPPMSKLTKKRGTLFYVLPGRKTSRSMV